MGTEEAIAAVGAANARWIEENLSIVDRVAFEKPFFTTDDLWDLTKGSPDERRAMGALIRAACRAGYCEITDRTVKSTRPECHKRPLRVWKSRYY